jgi:hypothetical protein
MTDHELLELAAKAAGYDFNRVWHDEQSGILVWEPPIIYESRDWNPLTDDCDALRLAVKLAIDIEWRPDGRIAAYRHANANGYCFTAFESSREDRAAAARRAITRAAAEIGKAMP